MLPSVLSISSLVRRKIKGLERWKFGMEVKIQIAADEISDA
jgi:hypothetical protein